VEIELADLTKKIADQDYVQDLDTIKYADLTKTKLKALADKLIKEAAAAIKHEELFQLQLAVTGQRPVTFCLEANIVNLPYDDYKKIANFFEDGKAEPVNVYFETISDYINVSKFRIDLFAAADDLDAQSDELAAKLAETMDAQIKAVRSYEAPKPAAKKPAAKTKTKKTTSKRSSKTKSTK
jgi:hypothetical protein